MEITGLAGLIILVLDVWAIISTVSSGVSVGKKVLWVIVILILPLIGFILWLFLGPKSREIRI